MKRNSVLKSIAVSVALSAFLTGCGSTATSGNDDANNDDSANLTTTSINGKAVDGYLQYATVCLDLSQDGYCQNTEPSTQTDTDGKFTLQITPEVQKHANYENAMLLVYGGKDVDTGVDFNGKLLAPKDGSTIVVTPISTLIAKAVQKELKGHSELSEAEIQEKIKKAKQKIAQALALSEQDLDKDPVEEQKAGNDKLIQAALQLQKAVEALLVSDTGLDKNERAIEIYEALIAGLDEMQEGDKGIGTLLDKTFQKAQNDKRVRELLGGDKGLQLGDAAKKVAQNIHERFEGFDEESKRREDFLQKIAAGTKEDLKRVEIAFEQGKVSEIAGQIKIDDGMFQADFDWDAKYIIGDLKLLDIVPTPDLVEKIKTFFNGHEKIRPGILLIKYERMGQSEDKELQEIYQKIRAYLAKQKQKEEVQAGKGSAEIVEIAPPMSIYMPDREGYEEVTFNSNNSLSFQKFKIQEDGTFASENDDDEETDTDFIYLNGKWTQHTEDTAEPYTQNKDGSITLGIWNEKVYIVKGKDIAGKTKEFPQYNIKTAMPNDAQMYFIKIEKLDDVYSLHDPVLDYSTQDHIPMVSLEEFIEKQCGTHWFIGNEQGGLAFQGTQTEEGYQCNTKAKSGKLIFVNKDSSGDVHTREEAGNWEIRTLSNGTEVLVAKPYNTKKIIDDEGSIEYPAFAVKDGTLYRGNLEPKGLKRVIPAYNKSALDSITQTITNNWNIIQQTMPSFEMGIKK